MCLCVMIIIIIVMDNGEWRRLPALYISMLLPCGGDGCGIGSLRRRRTGRTVWRHRSGRRPMLLPAQALGPAVAAAWAADASACPAAAGAAVKGER